MVMKQCFTNEKNFNKTKKISMQLQLLEGKTENLETISVFLPSKRDILS